MTRSDAARALLAHLLADDDVAGSAELRVQAGQATIRSSCECGCGSVGFTFDQEADVPASTAVSPYPVEGEILDAGGAVVGGLLLFLRDGRLNDLDVFSYGDPLPLPASSAVRWVVRKEPNLRILTAISGSDADALARRLRDEGWASHVTVENLVRTWEQVAHGVDTYDAMIDDYTNDVTARDALAEIMGWAEPPLRQQIERRIASADRRFRAATVDDAGEAVGRSFRIEPRDGWWWRRRPTSGPLAEWLDR